MKILYDVYKEIVDRIPDEIPETGGILGGHRGVITRVIFDEGIKDNVQMCHYIPNVCMLNECLAIWLEQGIEFYGLFHTHFFGVSSLSQGDIAYIKRILLAMPEEKKWLYFPIVVFPDKKIVSYRCSLDGEKLVVQDESISIVNHVEDITQIFRMMEEKT